MKRNNRQQFWFALLFPILAVLFCYIPIYNGPFILDDRIFLIEWPLLHNPSQYGEILKGALPPGHEGGYRPIRTLFEAFVALVFGTNAGLYHILAVIFHALTSGLIFFVILRLFEDLTDSSEHFNKLFVASFGSLVFGLHPLTTESVTFIQASFDSIGITLSLLSFYLALISPQRKISIVSLLVALVAFLFYELTYTLPAFILFTFFLIFVRHTGKKAAWKKSVFLSFPYFLLLFSVLILRIYILHLPTGRMSVSPHMIATILASTRAFFLYLVQTILPINLRVGHEISQGISTFGIEPAGYQRLSITDLPTILTVTGLIGAVGIILKTYKKIPLLALGIFWYIVALTPVLNIVVQGTIYAERYTYHSLVGFVFISISMLMLVFQIIKTETTRIFFLLIIFTGITICYGMLTISRVTEWSNPIYFWKKEISHLPNIAFYHNSLGMAYYSRGHIDLAVEEFKLAVQLLPIKSEYYHNTSIALTQSKQYKEAKIYIEKAIQLDPQNKKNLYQLQKIKALEKNDFPDN